jgi:hypothetical protein
MKTPLITALLALAGIAVAAYTLDWSTLDSGGGTSTGGRFQVAGTIGQPDAGSMTGGAYAINGGFWAMPELLQTPKGPPLQFLTAAGTTYLAWPAASPGWRLETSTNLTAWGPAPGVPAVSGDYNVVLPDLTTPRRYYRLAFP